MMCFCPSSSLLNEQVKCCPEYSHWYKIKFSFPSQLPPVGRKQLLLFCDVTGSRLCSYYGVWLCCNGLHPYSWSKVKLLLQQPSFAIKIFKKMIRQSDLHELLQLSELLVSFFWFCSISSLGCNHTDNNKALMSILSNLLCQRKYYAVSNDFGEKNSWALDFFLISLTTT